MALVLWGRLVLLAALVGLIAAFAWAQVRQRV
jgi:hypothetical protein